MTRWKVNFFVTFGSSWQSHWWFSIPARSSFGYDCINSLIAKSTLLNNDSNESSLLLIIESKSCWYKIHEKASSFAFYRCSISKFSVKSVPFFLLGKLIPFRKFCFGENTCKVFFLILHQLPYIHEKLEKTINFDLFRQFYWWFPKTTRNIYPIRPSVF